MMTKTEIRPDEGKLRELILYIAGRCWEHKTFGSVKLSKLLFLSDFYSYGLNGQPITGVPYVKAEQGPMPAQMMQIREAMRVDGAIAVKEELSPQFENSRKRVVPLRAADLKMFTADEIAIVDQVIEHNWDLTGQELSKLTHGYSGWRIAQNLYDPIPYNAVFLSDEEPTEYEKQHAIDLIEQYHWNV